MSSHHTEQISCPHCQSQQTATVEHTRPWHSYVHTCTQCGYIIGESEWQLADQQPTVDSTQPRCTRCEAEFGDEEAANPRLDKDADNEPICDQCYRNLYQITCPLCGDLFDDPQRWETNQYIYAPIGVEVPGIYRVNGWPFFGGPLLGDASYFEGAINLVKPLAQQDVEEGQFICPECIEKHCTIFSPQTI